MPALKTVAILLLAILAMLVIYILFSRGLVKPEFPTPDKDKLVRYYACMLAICTKGCGHDWLDENKTPDEIAICVERDPITKKCNKWCQDICDENNWNDECDAPGKCCDQYHNITVNLEGRALLRGIYEWPSSSSCDPQLSVCRYKFKTGLEDTISELNNSENFPNYVQPPCEECFLNKDLLDCCCPWRSFTVGSFTLDLLEYGSIWSPGQWNSMFKTAVICRIDESGHTTCSSGELPGRGDIFLLPTDARKIFGCTRKPIPIFHHIPITREWGYYQCLFEGSIRMWALSSQEGCADIAIVSNRYHPDHFILEVTPAKQVKPVGLEATYTASIDNNIYSLSEVEFTLWLDTFDNPNITCYWPDSGNEVAYITVKNDTVGSLQFNCTAKSEGAYDIKVIARGSLFEEHVIVKLIASDFSVKCGKEPCEAEAIAGRINQISDILIVENRLNKDENFNIRLSVPEKDGKNDKDYSNEVNCHVVPNPLFVENYSSAKASLICNPSLDARGHNYTIKFEVSPEDYPSLVKTISLTLKVPRCAGLDSLIFWKEGMGKIIKAKAGDKINITVTAPGCDGRDVKIAVGDPGYVIATRSIMDGKAKYTIRIGKDISSSDSTYTFYALMDLDKPEDHKYDKPGENISEDLTVSPPDSQAEREECTKCNGKWCTYSFGTSACLGTVHADICDQFKGIGGCSLDDCKDALDPQECEQDKDLGCAKYSNLCCINNNDGYSSGPDAQIIDCDDFTTKEECESYGCSWEIDYCDIIDCYFKCTGGAKAIRTSPAPCLSPDFNTHNDQNEYFQWDSVDDARNVLVRELDGNERVATIHNGGWLMSKISDTSRPVYGIILHVLKETDGCQPVVENACVFDWAPMKSTGTGQIFLHNPSGWFKISEFTLTVRSNENEKKRTLILTPSGKWAWENIDAIKIVNVNSFVCCSPWTNPGLKYPRSSSIKVNYIGLLTKDGTTPFCTEGSGDYNRIVDNGKTCYWGLDCEASGEGWIYPPEYRSTKTGFAGECDCSSGTCGLGYCEKEIDGVKYCFSGVRCMNGGWRWENFERCDPGEVCTWEGCK